MKIKKIFLFLLLITLTLAGGSKISQVLSISVQADNKQVNNKLDVIVSFDRNPGKAERAFFESLGGKVKHDFTIIPAFAGSLPQQAMDVLSRSPRVTAVELDLPVYAVDYTAEAELTNSWGVEHIKAGEVHGFDEGDGLYLGKGIKVAVIDSGVDYNHRDLAGNFVVEEWGYDFVEDDDKPMDVYGHGTHVAGTVAAVKDDFGAVGVGPEVQLIALRILNDDGVGSSTNTIAALDWIVNDYNVENSDNPIRITNNSYGRGTESGAVRDAFDAAAEKGVLHIAAAGNSGNPAGRGDNVIYPAKYESVVAVAAIDKNNKRPKWSSTGPAVELAAPGVSVLSTWNSETSYADPQPFSFAEDPDSYYKEGSGTSMASPHVAGTAALAMSYHGVFSPQEVRDIMNQTAINIGDANQYGHGLVNASAVINYEQDTNDENDEENGDDTEDPGQSAPVIEDFNIIDDSNPAWVKATIEWSVSDKDGDLAAVESQMLTNEEVIDSETSSVSGKEASGTHSLRTRSGNIEDFEFLLTVSDSEDNTDSQTNTIN